MEKSDKERLAETVIQKEIGIKPGTSLLTPMDYGECVWCIIIAVSAEHERSQQELQAYKDIIKELLPIAESHLFSAEYGYNSEEYCAKLRDIIKRSNKLIDTVTPT